MKWLKISLRQAQWLFRPKCDCMFWPTNIFLIFCLRGQGPPPRNYPISTIVSHDQPLYNIFRYFSFSTYHSIVHGIFFSIGLRSLTIFSKVSVFWVGCGTPQVKRLFFRKIGATSITMPLCVPITVPLSLCPGHCAPVTVPLSLCPYHCAAVECPSYRDTCYGKGAMHLLLSGSPFLTLHFTLNTY